MICSHSGSRLRRYGALCRCRTPRPRVPPRKTVLQSARGGLRYLKRNPGILHLILFLAIINLTASIYNAALPAMLLSREGGSEFALGAVNTVTGLATLAGSILVTALPAPKSRVRVILNTLLFSMSTENFLLAFGRGLPVWCAGVVMGWLFIPMMGANMDVLFRSKIPIEMQGRVVCRAKHAPSFSPSRWGICWAARWSTVCLKPLMAALPAGSLPHALFGMGKGSGAAFLFFVIALFGSLSCLPFRADRAIRGLEAAGDGVVAGAEPDVPGGNVEAERVIGAQGE